ncbi:MAG: NAD(P)-dependent oxidoreductase [Capsulimonadales bacterium]|nr:NAD(P)-dependent oxidoreductase [Capsulimonadales bacterium]
MRVLVTGTAGRVGSVVAREFLAHGYQVRGLDKNPPHEDLRGRIETVYADLTDRFALLRAADGCEAIAHLAAIPTPSHGEEGIFPTNVTGTQYLLAAAEATGIRRVALASTCCTFGIYFARHPFDPQYFPMDERHPALPQDMYGLSKLLNEETAAAYTRRAGITTVCLRLTTVVDFGNRQYFHWWRHGLTSDRERRNDMWSYVDVRDAARAFRLAIENAVDGTSAVAIIARRDSLTAHDIRHLVKRHFPALAPQVETFEPTQCLYRTDMAENAFGFVAEHSWREVPELSDLKPEFNEE